MNELQRPALERIASGIDPELMLPDTQLKIVCNSNVE